MATLNCWLASHSFSEWSCFIPNRVVKQGISRPDSAGKWRVHPGFRQIPKGRSDRTQLPVLRFRLPSRQIPRSPDVTPNARRLEKFSGGGWDHSATLHYGHFNRVPMSLVFKREQARGHPELSLLGFNLRQLLENVQSGFPALISRPLEVWIQTQPTLACVVEDSPSACIRLHSVLNHPQTPERVVAFILEHELLHLIVPPREVNSERKLHPPEFWEAEKRVSQDRGLAWGWITLVLGDCLRRDKRAECTFVKANWKRLMNSERPTMERIGSIMESSTAAARVQEGPLL